MSSILGGLIKAVDAAMVDVNFHDSRPDLITLTGSVLAERLQLANGPSASRKSSKNGTRAPGVLAVGDVNGDNNPDIYALSAAGTGPRTRKIIC